MKANSTYKVDVLKNNSIFKQSVRSTNKGLKLLKVALSNENGTKKTISQINKVLKSDTLYKELCKDVRKTKNGETTVFYILQSLYRLEKNKNVVSNTKVVKTTNSKSVKKQAA